MLSTTSSTITCSICLGDILEGNSCKTNCNHEFCKTCLDLWFDKNKLSCPMCRTEIKYFNYNGIDNRVVSIYRLGRQRQPNHVNATSIILTKKVFIILNFGITFSMITNCILFGLWGACSNKI